MGMWNKFVESIEREQESIRTHLKKHDEHYARVIKKHEGRKQTSHFTHLVMTFLTCGFWIPIWVVCTLSNGQHNKNVEANRQEAFMERMVAGRGEDDE